MTALTVDPPRGTFSAEQRVPGDKSMSHRALILSAMASGVSEVLNLGPGQDIETTRQAVTALGVEFRGDQLSSPGIDGWTQPIRVVKTPPSLSIE